MAEVFSPNLDNTQPMSMQTVTFWGIDLRYTECDALQQSNWIYLSRSKDDQEIQSMACRDPGSNWGSSDLQSDALPTEPSRLVTIFSCISYVITTA